MKYLFITVNVCDNTIGFGIIYILHIIEVLLYCTQTIHYVTFMTYIKILFSV